MKYRPEIDGLRAIAVLPVIFFHAGFNLFSGGFVGVDIFFVISGFLITSILIEEIENKQFSISNFYERRVRRILPALFFVLLVCILLGWLWLLPSQMKEFSQSLIAVSFFSSNIYFWKKSGYFDAASDEMPLLHTWSLAVEEQYYVIFPIFLLLTWKFGKNKVFWIIVVMSVISFLLSEWGWRNDKDANFFLAPTRAWELFSGSICAFIEQKKIIKKNNALSFLGLVAIIGAVFVYDQSTPIPSIYALLPVIGVMLFILYGKKDTFAAKILSLKFFVGIGLISYSIYLWHHPIFAFFRIKSHEHPSDLLMFILIIISIFFGYLSWRYVETPFRGIKTKKNPKKILFVAAIGLLFFLLIGLYGSLTKGIPGRMPNDFLDTFNKSKELNLNEINCHLGPGHNETELNHPIMECVNFSTTRQTDIVFIGDSHLGSISYALQKNLIENGIESYAVSYTSCMPIRGIKLINQDSKNLCPEYNKSMIEYARSVGASKLVLFGRWDLYILGTAYNNGEGVIENNGKNFGAVDLIDIDKHSESNRVDRVKKHIIKEVNKLSEEFEVYIIEPIPIPGWNVPDQFLSDKQKGVINRTHSLDSYLNRIAIFKDIYRDLNDDVKIIKTTDLLCNSQKRCIVENNDGLLYRDSNHLSFDGANLIAPSIVRKLMY